MRGFGALRGLIGVALVASFVACGGDDDPTAPDDLELEGLWTLVTVNGDDELHNHAWTNGVSIQTGELAVTDEGYEMWIEFPMTTDSSGESVEIPGHHESGTVSRSGLSITVTRSDGTTFSATTNASGTAISVNHEHVLGFVLRERFPLH